MDDTICASCGRAFSWRKKWTRQWDAVRFCSTGCRTNRPGPLDRRLEGAILHLRDRSTGTIYPSEAARFVRPDAWRPLMERTRRAARRLAAGGQVAIFQGGRPVDSASVRGPIRIGGVS
ncbi:MAG: DUF3253 domain-containing protein [Acidimicrobiia bacterium]|nr:DUF3253 domain-containing protein [Acidimicrobiia bacterium]